MCQIIAQVPASNYRLVRKHGKIRGKCSLVWDKVEAVPWIFSMGSFLLVSHGRLSLEPLDFLTGFRRRKKAFWVHCKPNSLQLFSSVKKISLRGRKCWVGWRISLWVSHTELGGGTGQELLWRSGVGPSVWFLCDSLAGLHTGAGFNLLKCNLLSPGFYRNIYFKKYPCFSVLPSCWEFILLKFSSCK